MSVELYWWLRGCAFGALNVFALIAAIYIVRTFHD